MDSIELRQKPTEYYEEIQNKKLTIRDSLYSPVGNLLKIKRINGDNYCKALVVKLVSDVCRFFNFNRNLNEEQMVQTVNLVIECYPDFTIEDFVRCFKGMKTGKYGKFYEGMDGAKILNCLESYGIERDNEIIEFRRNQSNEQKKSDKYMFNDLILPVLKNVSSKIEEKKIDVKVREKTESEILIQEWFKLFDKIHYKQEGKHDSCGLRMVEYNNKIVDINKFINLKIEEK
jgi:hypothetical protein